MITFQDKVNLNTDTSIADINKIKDSDINALKNGVNANETNITTLQTNVTNINGTKLWENQDPTEAITTDTTISLSSSDYDVLEIFFQQRTHTTFFTYSARMLKSSTGTRLYLPTTDGNMYRNLTKSTDTSYVLGTMVGHPTSDNTLVIPLYIIGYKLGVFD